TSAAGGSSSPSPPGRGPSTAWNAIRTSDSWTSSKSDWRTRVRGFGDGGGLLHGQRTPDPLGGPSGGRGPRGAGGGAWLRGARGALPRARRGGGEGGRRGLPLRSARARALGGIARLGAALRGLPRRPRSRGRPGPRRGASRFRVRPLPRRADPPALRAGGRGGGRRHRLGALPAPGLRAARMEALERAGAAGAGAAPSDPQRDEAKDAHPRRGSARGGARGSAPLHHRDGGLVLRGGAGAKGNLRAGGADPASPARPAAHRGSGGRSGGDRRVLGGGAQRGSAARPLRGLPARGAQRASRRADAGSRPRPRLDRRAARRRGEPQCRVMTPFLPDFA